MDDEEAAPAPPRLMFTPLMISLMGIVSTALAIVVYNFILTRFCARRQSPRDNQGDCEKGSGVEEKVLHSIPVLSYKTARGGLLSVDHTECVVCLGEFEEGEVIRLLPNCRHAFHVQCIDEWFFSHSSCPVCRSPILPQPFNTNLPPTTGNVQEDCLLDQAEMGSNNDRRVLRNCSSAVVRADKLSSAPVDLKRSLSVDCTYVAVKIQRGTERDSGSSSSLSNEMLLLRTESGSSKGFDHTANPFSRLRTNQCDAGHEVHVHPR